MRFLKMLLVCIAFSSGNGFAAVVTASFGGILNQAGSPTTSSFGLENSIHVGEAFSGEFAYDDSQPPYQTAFGGNPGHPEDFSYYTAGTFTIHLHNFTIQTPASWAQVHNSPAGSHASSGGAGYDGFSVYQYLPFAVAGAPGAVTFMSAGWSDVTGSIVSDTHLPAASFFATPGLNGDAFIIIQFTDGTDNFVISGNISSVTAVPEPANAYLLLAGCACLSLMAWQRRFKNGRLQAQDA